MRYRAVPFTLEHVQHAAVVEELVHAGLDPAGCIVDDLTAGQAARLVRGYAKEHRAALLAEVGRPTPVLVSRDRTTAVAVSDLYGEAAVRMRTFLADGSLVETQRRWQQLPPWPGRLAPFRRFTTVEKEMMRSAAPGRSVMLSTRSAADQVEEHREHVDRVAARRGTTAVGFPDMESVAAAWTAALAHEEAVRRRSDRLFSAGLVALAALIVVLPNPRVSDVGWTVLILSMAVVLWWGAPGVAVLMRQRTRGRPAFTAARPNDVP
jgi:hypothetical protein